MSQNHRVRWSYGLIGLLILAIYVALLVLPMGWGLMDDPSVLYALRHRWHEWGFLETMRRESTIGWFRPVYTAFAYLGYSAFDNSPKAFYLANFTTVIVSLLPWVAFLRNQFEPERRPVIAVLFGFLLLSATPLYNLVVYLSLQEKFVLLFAGTALWALDGGLRAEPSRSPIRGWGIQALAAGSLLLGLWSKPTTLFVVPGAMLLLLVTKRQPVWRRAIVLSFWVLMAGWMGSSFIHRRDSYSASYVTEPAAVLQIALHQPITVYLFAILAILAFGAAFVKPRRLDLLVWPVMLLTYLGLLVPWGINTYLWVPAMVPAAACTVILSERLRERWRESQRRNLDAIAVCAAASAAILVVGGIAVPRLRRQSEIPRVVQWLSERIPDPRLDLFVLAPCMEAAGGLQHLTGDRQPIQILRRNAPITSAKERVWLITRDECPIEPDRIHQFDQVLLTLPHWAIYESIR